MCINCLSVMFDQAEAGYYVGEEQLTTRCAHTVSMK